MNVRPLHDKVLVKRVEPEAITRGGIIIPEDAKTIPIEAHVVEVGQGRYLKNGRLVRPELKPGDRVLLAKYRGEEVVLDGEKHLITSAEDILGVFG